MERQIGERYAKAFYLFTKEKGTLDKVYATFLALVQSTSWLPFVNFWKKKGLTWSRKKELWKRFIKNLPPKVESLFLFIFHKNRTEVLVEVVTEFVRYYEIEMKLQEVKLITYTTMAPSLEEKVKSICKQLGYKKIRIINKIDKTILGGCILQINNKYLDFSLHKRFIALKKHLNIN